MTAVQSNDKVGEVYTRFVDGFNKIIVDENEIDWNRN
jgi:hypothetical protein